MANRNEAMNVEPARRCTLEDVLRPLRRGKAKAPGEWREFYQTLDDVICRLDATHQAHIAALEAQNAVSDAAIKGAIIENARQRERIAELEAENARLSGQWRCFHCDETFTDADAAKDHFGSHELRDAACQLDAAALRRAEDELERYRAEDSDKDREMYGMQADHAAALRREEERGYDRGVSDMHAENAALRTAAEGAKVALEKAGGQFAHYALLHYQKGTPDGDRKGDTNRDFAHEITAALAALTAALESEREDSHD